GPTSRTISNITVGSGQVGINYIFAATGAIIGGTVFVDANRDSVMQTGEAGLGGVLVTLSQGNTVIATTLSRLDGSYVFGGAAPGTYDVTETVPSGYSGANTVTSVSNITVGAGAIVGGQNLGVTTGSLAGVVYLDQNVDLARDNGDGTLAGVVVKL